MKPFLFCPSCAHELDEPAEEGGARCPSCGRSWYRNPSPTVGAAIVREGKVLLTVRAKDPYKGKVDVPGGFLNVGEDPLEGLQRELDEELGVRVDASMQDCLQISPHLYGDEDEWTLAIGFRARITAGEPQPADDVADILWVGEDELDGIDFAWDHDRDLAREALRRG